MPAPSVPRPNPFDRVVDRPDHVAVAVSNGERLTREELDRRSARVAALLRDSGVRFGDSVAILLPNGTTMYEVAWGAHRLGLAYTPVNWHLTPAEAAHIVNDSGATILVVWAPHADALAALTPGVRRRFVVGADPNAALPGGHERFEDATAAADPWDGDDLEGKPVLYSSGTTGAPKAIVSPMTPVALGADAPLDPILRGWFGVDDTSVMLVAGPLYHAMPLAFSMGAHRIGATVVVMERFDAEAMLALIATHGVTHAVVVPTMLSRTVKLPEKVRARSDVTSLRGVVHAGAPCPPEVKRAIIDWWGPIVHEFYSATEGIGMTWITSDEWLEHPGSVGRPVVGAVHVLDDSGHEVPSGEIGRIYFEGGWEFEYRGDADKNRDAKSAQGWSTVGDLGHVDADGYLFLSGRRTDLILSGGVNVYPVEIENALIAHPSVLDATVIGIPDDDLGQCVHAVVSLVPGCDAGTAHAELVAHCAATLARYKCPRSFAFVDDLPRQPNGKVRKHELLDQYVERLR